MDTSIVRIITNEHMYFTNITTPYQMHYLLAEVCVVCGVSSKYKFNIKLCQIDISLRLLLFVVVCCYLCASVVIVVILGFSLVSVRKFSWEWLLPICL
jgi:hypothetical protein